VAPKARKTIVIAGEFPMHRGGSLVSPTIAYETWGQLNQKRDNAVLIFTGMSPPAHAASSADDPAPGWWEEMIGPGRPLDTRRYFVVCVNSLGSCFGSTGPSMGGMSALAFEILFPGMSEGFVSMSSGPRALPFSIALRSLQREMIRKDPGWMGGNYPRDAVPLTGMRLARKLGMITYRSAEEWRLRFGRERTTSPDANSHGFGMTFEIEAYLEHHANKFTGQFDPNCYLYLSRASDLFDVAEHGGSVEVGLGKVRVKRALIVGVTTDFLFPIYQQRELAEGLGAPGREVEFVELNSLQGHDSFLVDMDSYRPLIARFFA